MSLSLEGIGAVLGQQLDYTQIVSVVPGGPAFKSKRIFEKDKVIAVAQGDDGEFVDVVGWRLDEVVQKIRGLAQEKSTQFLFQKLMSLRKLF